VTENAQMSQMLQCLSCKIHGKSCFRERDDTFVLVLFFRYKPSWFKPVKTSCLAETGFCWQKPNPGWGQCFVFSSVFWHCYNNNIIIIIIIIRFVKRQNVKRLPWRVLVVWHSLKDICRSNPIRTCTTIHRVKWRHISVVAIRLPFCRSPPSYCA